MPFGSTPLCVALATSTSASGSGKNESADSGAATNIGMGFKRKNVSDETYMKPEVLVPSHLDP